MASNAIQGPKIDNLIAKMDGLIDEVRKSMSSECGVCHQCFLTKTMSICSNCGGQICQKCHESSVWVGCEKESDERVCTACINNKLATRVYCQKFKCNCYNRKPSEPDDSLHNESSASSNEDTDFVMRKCGVCTERAIGKSMYPCPICNLPICQGCQDNSFYMGCTQTEESDPVCSKCVKSKYKGRRKYCSVPDCDCNNPSPKRVNIIITKAEIEQQARQRFIELVNVDEWKKTHKPISFKSQHKGKYLIDLFINGNDWERGYANWLVKLATVRPKGQSDADYEIFQSYRKEAKEILDLFETCKKWKSNYNLRNRDRSPKRN